MGDGTEQKMISTNAATAIKKMAFALYDKHPTNKSVISNASDRWSQALDLGAVGSGCQLVIVEHVNRSVFPLFTRAQAQVGTLPIPMVTQILNETKQAFFDSLGSIHPTNYQKLEQMSDASTGQLTMIEQAIGHNWGPIPAEALNDIEKHVEDCRELLDELVSADTINELIHAPLIDALDWCLRSVRASKHLGVLIGVGPALNELRTRSETLIVVADATLTIDASQREAWQKLKQGFAILAAFGVVVGVAGFTSPLLFVPAVASGAMTAFEFTGQDDTLMSIVDRMIAHLLPPAETPALDAGETPALQAGDPADHDEGPTA